MRGDVPGPHVAEGLTQEDELSEVVFLSPRRLCWQDFALVTVEDPGHCGDIRGRRDELGIPHHGIREILAQSMPFPTAVDEVEGAVLVVHTLRQVVT